PSAVAEHLRERDRAARLEPSSVMAVAALCLAYQADMLYDQAERCYTRAEELVPDEWRFTYYRALAEGERGSGGLPAAALRRVVAAAPEFGPAWWRLGEAEFKQGHLDRAEDAWRRAAAAAEAPREPVSGSPDHVAANPLAAYAGLGLARVEVQRERL